MSTNDDPVDLGRERRRGTLGACRFAAWWKRAAHGEDFDDDDEP